MKNQLSISKTFALLAAGMILVSISGCRKENIRPESPANTVTLDGKSKTVTKAGIDMVGLERGTYDIFLFLSEEENIIIQADKEHYDGKTIDLTKKEPYEEKRAFWIVEYYNPKKVIDTYGAESEWPAFISGTLYVKRLEDDAQGKPVFEIKLENGKVKCEGEYGDGKEHTVSVYYKGSLEPGEYVF